MSETVKVVVGVQARITAGVEVEMTREEFEAWDKRLDVTDRWGAEDAADELASKAGIDWEFGDLSDMEVEQFEIVKE